MASYYGTNNRGAFSLVEVVIALGIVSFAVLSMVALLPIGITTFHNSMEISLSSEKREEILNSLQQANITTLLQSQNPYVQVNYYDQYGTLLGTSTPGLAATLTSTPTYQITVTVTPNLPTAAAGSFVSAPSDQGGGGSTSVVNAALVTTQFSRYLPSGTSTSNTAALANQGNSTYKVETDYLLYTNMTAGAAP
jgi:uncharacterized protein (TIGR02598 family)